MTLRRFIFWLHLGTGVLIGLVIGFLAITGSILAFQNQIVSWAERGDRIGLPPLSACVAPSSLLKSASDYAHRAPLTLTLFSDPHRPAEVLFGTDSVLLLGSCDGHVIDSGATRLRAFFSGVRDLHRWAALNGVRHETLRGIKDACVLVFLFLIVTGLVLWFPRKITWNHLKPSLFFRSGMKGRAREWNWHQVFGVWMALPLTAIALSGIVMAYPWANALLYRAAGDHLISEKTETAPKRAKPLPADGFQLLDPAILKAIAQDAQWKSIEMRLPSAKEPNVTFRVEEGDGGNPRQRAQLVLARKDGSIVLWEPFSATPRGRQWRLYARFLHTGEMFGIVGRSIALLACVSALTLVWTGFSLSFRRFAFWRRRGTTTGPIRRQEEVAMPVSRRPRV